MSVLLETSLGSIVLDTNPQSPLNAQNFLKLALAKYYTHSLIESAQRGFGITLGANPGTITTHKGDCTYHTLAKRKREGEGIVQEKTRKPKRGDAIFIPPNRSKFIILTGDENMHLEGYTVFAHVAEGMDVVDKIDNVFVDTQHRPLRDIRITHAYVLEDPYDEDPDLPIREDTPPITKEQLDTGRLAEEDTIEEPDEKVINAKEAAARALTLEMLGDLPSADIRPPENILFVCKLNPITRDEDLHLIFGRFGEIASCEVIRDKKTGDSLSYAFIEFEEKSAAEEAYFKMDNVLIDDRRIHVDFSQSVSKLHGAWLEDRRLSSGDAMAGLEKKRQYRVENLPTGKTHKMLFDHSKNGRPERSRLGDQDTFRKREHDDTRRPYSSDTRSGRQDDSRPRREDSHKIDRLYGRERSPR